MYGSGDYLFYSPDNNPNTPPPTSSGDLVFVSFGTASAYTRYNPNIANAIAFNYVDAS
jgi:hypothetical protein